MALVARIGADRSWGAIPVNPLVVRESAEMLCLLRVATFGGLMYRFGALADSFPFDLRLSDGRRLADIPLAGVYAALVAQRAHPPRGLAGMAAEDAGHVIRSLRCVRDWRVWAFAWRVLHQALWVGEWRFPGAPPRPCLCGAPDPSVDHVLFGCRGARLWISARSPLVRS